MNVSCAYAHEANKGFEVIEAAVFPAHMHTKSGRRSARSSDAASCFFDRCAACRQPRGVIAAGLFDFPKTSGGLCSGKRSRAIRQPQNLIRTGKAKKVPRHHRRGAFP